MINVVLNDPSVFPSITSPAIEYLDASSLIQDHANIFLACEGGHVFFIAQGAGFYEGQANFIEGYRGAYALAATRDALASMFLGTDCMTVNMRIPEPNKAAGVFAERLGAVREFDRQSVWATHTGLAGMSFRTLRYVDWVRRANGLETDGKAFVKAFIDERSRLGANGDFPDHDNCVFRHVGAMAAMLYAGQLEKAIWLYNQFACLAGLAPVALISASQGLVEIDGTLLKFVDGAFKALRI
jgi:hypothetical protein